MKKKTKMKEKDFANICAHTMQAYQKSSISHCGLACAVIVSLAKHVGIKTRVTSCTVIDPEVEILGNGHHFVILNDKYVFDLTLNQFFPSSPGTWPVFWLKDAPAVKDFYGKYKLCSPTFEKKLLKSVEEDGRSDIFNAFYVTGYNQIKALQ